MRLKVRKFSIMLVTIFCLFNASQAQALSCLRPNIGAVFNDLHVSGEPFAIAEGEFTTIKSSWWRQLLAVFGKEQRGGTYTGFFTGKIVDPSTENNKALQVEGVPVTITVSCISAWCGHQPDLNTKHFVFLMGNQQTGYTLPISACGGMVFSPIEGAQPAALSNCLTNKKCSTDDINAFE